jgi:hypothetical protein
MEGGDIMLITADQLNQIAAGTHVYVSCDWCGHGEVVPVDPYRLVQGGRCPCGQYHDEAGHGMDFGYGWGEDRRQFGLDYQFHAGDFTSGY